MAGPAQENTASGKFMKLEHGEGCHLMKGIKELPDPKGFMNPGKVFI